MGAFYVNFTVKTADRAKAVESLRQAGRNAFITPVLSGCIIVTEQAADEQNPMAIEEVGRLLSADLAAPVLAVLNHDDDILGYWLFERGRTVDEYNSDPGYFSGEDIEASGGDAHLLCSSFLVEMATDQVKTILADRDGYTFAQERHTDLLDALQLPAAAVGFGYRYVEAGEELWGIDIHDLVKTN